MDRERSPLDLHAFSFILRWIEAPIEGPFSAAQLDAIGRAWRQDVSHKILLLEKNKPLPTVGLISAIRIPS